ncbi:Ppx/GppA phosphatase family protein [Marinimicrobium sp. ABcell2]|uniref:Ppx/GppA phosphatase family protein n=1 Tax=Marinimicrobium sp. ABcell2 TaxID=3069751 RepID=UPI0027B501F0|nr:Ppx/GppA phosphatase family protein [Marinimicrobium sp. ABcell2]MDQ2076116.1 Ppx/GppA phosphatase family protein [Marinimicrobium sp. ABcell2]
MFNLSRLFADRAAHIAAIDLGSNSFHLIIARWEDEQLTLLDRLREPVRLGWGLEDSGELDAAAWERAMACLERFGERLREYPSRRVRAVGTKTLRSIIDSQEFLQQAQQRLGHPVEIISGEEEARLVYLGVAHCIAPGEGQRVVLDIGGGSTEVILGRGMAPELKESLSMGCVALTKKFFIEGKVTDTLITRARVACLQELAPVSDAFVEAGWNEALGASGTIKAVAKVCEENGWSDGTITEDGLHKIIDLYRRHKTLELDIKGLPDDRRPVFLGGVIVLAALFESLRLEQVTAADWALREGLLYDLKGRLEDRDIREESINALARRFHVNLDKAAQVEQTCLALLEQVEEPWQLNRVEAGKLLTWAARLYALGLDIAHGDYHKHSAYIVEHVDLAGCSRLEQKHLAALVLAHRKRFPVKDFPMEEAHLIHLAILLRLAVIFHRTQKKSGPPPVSINVGKSRLRLSFPAQWLDSNPLTRADLETERGYLQDLGYRLVLARH